MQIRTCWALKKNQRVCHYEFIEQQFLRIIFFVSFFTPYSFVPFCSRFFRIPYSCTWYARILRRLPCYKSSPDILCALFRGAAQVLSEPMTIFFNLSLSTYCVPSVLKNFIVTHVPKIAAPSIRDLRLISLSPISLKIFETLVLNR